MFATTSQFETHCMLNYQCLQLFVYRFDVNNATNTILSSPGRGIFDLNLHLYYCLFANVWVPAHSNSLTRAT